MDAFTILILLIVFFYFVGKANSKKRGKASKSSKGSRAPSIPRNPEDRDFPTMLKIELPMLKARAEAMDEQRKTGKDLGFASWMYEPASDRQIEYLKELGCPKKALKELTKGTASDFIGLMHNPSNEEEEPLRILGAWKSNLTQTGAREKLRVLLRDPANIDKLKNRPPRLEQKVFARLYGVKLPAKATADAASEAISQFIEADQSRSDALENALNEIDFVIDELSDAETRREDYEIKKPSQKALVDAFQALGLAALESGEVGTDDVVEKLIEQNPDIELG